jgi:uncharacterized membrane protein
MDITHHSVTEHVVIRHQTPAQTVQWLQRALRDLRRAPADALFYGILFVGMGYALAIYFEAAPSVILTLSTLFLLVGPFLAIGLYDLARQLEGQPAKAHVSLRQSLVAWHENLQGFTLYAALLAVVAFMWFRVSLLMFALFYDYSMVPTLNKLFVDAFLPQNRVFLFAYFATGFFFALVVFAASVVAVPMMLDKEIDTVSAMIASFQVVQQNLLTMTVWAAMIVLLTAVGLASFFIGLLVTMPLIGMATWHAYRDLITYEQDRT